MLWLVARLILLFVAIDLLIGLAFVGVIGWGWLREEYISNFPNGLWIINKISEVLKCWRNKL